MKTLPKPGSFNTIQERDLVFMIWILIVSEKEHSKYSIGNLGLHYLFEEGHHRIALA
jgi:hypothetical protein